jgi:hypothetical protein
MTSYENEIALKSRLASLADAVRQKYLEFRFGNAFKKEQLEKKYQPITTKLDALLSKTANRRMKTDPDELGSDPDLFLTDPDRIKSDPDRIKSDPDRFLTDPDDPTYGVRLGGDNELYMGYLNVPVEMGESIMVGEKHFPRTPGLEHLLWHKSVPKDYTKDDLYNYHEILALSNAVFRTDSSGRIIQAKGSKSEKYKKLIQPYLENLEEKTAAVLGSEEGENIPPKGINRGLKQSKRKTQKPTRTGNRHSDRDTDYGEGLPRFMSLKKSHEFVYYDNIEELISRLRILVASRTAGNTSVDNEILNIEEELREAGVIA